MLNISIYKVFIGECNITLYATPNPFLLNKICITEFWPGQEFNLDLIIDQGHGSKWVITQEMRLITATSSILLYIISKGYKGTKNEG